MRRIITILSAAGILYPELSLHLSDIGGGCIYPLVYARIIILFFYADFHYHVFNF